MELRSKRPDFRVLWWEHTDSVTKAFNSFEDSHNSFHSSLCGKDFQLYKALVRASGISVLCSVHKINVRGFFFYIYRTKLTNASHTLQISMLRPFVGKSLAIGPNNVKPERIP